MGEFCDELPSPAHAILGCHRLAARRGLNLGLGTTAAVAAPTRQHEVRPFANILPPFWALELVVDVGVHERALPALDDELGETQVEQREGAVAQRLEEQVHVVHLRGETWSDAVGAGGPARGACRRRLVCTPGQRTSSTSDESSAGSCASAALRPPILFSALNHSSPMLSYSSVDVLISPPRIPLVPRTNSFMKTSSAASVEKYVGDSVPILA